MTTVMRQERTLLLLIVRRIVLFASLAAILQIGIVFLRYYRDDAELARLILDAETTGLSQGLKQSGGRLSFSLPPFMDRYGTGRDGYLTRIRSFAGAELFSNCSVQCSSSLLPDSASPPVPDLWFRQTEPGKPIGLAGGRSFDIGSQRILIEVAMTRDPSGVMWLVIGHELIDDMAVPMILMLVCVVGATILSTRHALRPIEEAAARAEVLDPLDETIRLSTKKMPLEFAHLARAVNRAIARISELIKSQQVFSTAVAHEIRTPLAIMKLELGHIADQRARQVEKDLDQLANFVEHITSLARLETVGTLRGERLETTQIGRTIVTALAPWIYARGHTIAFVDNGSSCFRGEATLVENALRNLVENAVRHTPSGTAITVEAGPGAMLSVVDDAGAYTVNNHGSIGFPGTRKHADGMGVGLEIVRRIAALHGASFRITGEAGRYTRASILFQASDPYRNTVDPISATYSKGPRRDE